MSLQKPHKNALVQIPMDPLPTRSNYIHKKKNPKKNPPHTHTKPTNLGPKGGEREGERAQVHLFQHQSGDRKPHSNIKDQTEANSPLCLCCCFYSFFSSHSPSCSSVKGHKKLILAEVQVDLRDRKVSGQERESPGWEKWQTDKRNLKRAPCAAAGLNLH